jgi:type VI secretion system secreted protein VgrG
VPGEPFRIRLPDQSVRTGTTDRKGKVRFERITAGQATITYTGFDTKEWQPA